MEKIYRSAEGCHKDALGPYNGAVVVFRCAERADSRDRQSEIGIEGRVSTLLHRQGDGVTGLIERGTVDATLPVRISLRGMQMNMTTALAFSDNAFFARLGRRTWI